MVRSCFSFMVLILAATPLAILHFDLAGRKASALQGTWQVVASQHNGNADPSHTGSRLIFQGNVVTFQPGEIRFENLVAG